MIIEENILKNDVGTSVVLSVRLDLTGSPLGMRTEMLVSFSLTTQQYLRPFQTIMERFQMQLLMISLFKTFIQVESQMFFF